MEIQGAKNRLAEALGGDIHLRQQVNFEDNLDILREHIVPGLIMSPLGTINQLENGRMASVPRFQPGAVLIPCEGRE